MKNINKEMFEGVIAFSFSEPGAMGPNDCTFYKSNGESFSVDYLSEETPYSMLKEYFPVLLDCYWNGPMKDETKTDDEYVIGVSDADNSTQIPHGWKHIYVGYGNHIIVKAELYNFVEDILKNEDCCDVAFCWTDMLDKAEVITRILR